MGRFEKSQLVAFCRRKNKVGFRLLAEALCRAPQVLLGADGKVFIKRWYLYPYVEKPFNSKVIKKSFVPELRSRKMFFVFWDSYVLCIYVMNILYTFHISVSLYVTLHFWTFKNMNSPIRTVSYEVNKTITEGKLSCLYS